MKCPLCGEPVSQDDLYCGNCGYNLVQDRDDWEENDVSLAASEEAPVEMSDVSEPPLPEESSDFSLPADSGEKSGQGDHRDKTWRAIVVVAALFLFLACCCCVGVFYMFSWSGAT